MNPVFPPPGYVPAPSKVDGIEVFQPAPKAEPVEQDVVTFICPNCGATTQYDVKTSGLICPHCGYHLDSSGEVVGKRAEEGEFTLETMQKVARGWGDERRELLCQNCGASTTIPVENLTHTCAFCGSNKVIQRPASDDILRPRFLIPFKITTEECQKIAIQWLGSSWMTPAQLKEIANAQGLTPLFLPYWTFDALTEADWRAEVGNIVTERYYDAGDKTWKTRSRTDWRWESGKTQVPIDDLLVPGTGRLSTRHLEKINQFDLSNLVVYNSQFLAGLQALGYDITLEAAWEIGRQEMRERTRQACRNQASTSMIRNFSMQVEFANESWRYILLPVYVASYTYQGKAYQVLVNGVNGVISGTRPVDWNKIWIAIAALIFPGFLLCLAGLVTLPLFGAGTVIGGIGFVLLLIGVVISIIIAIQANASDDV